MSQAQPSGRLTDHIGLGVLSGRFHRDLIEEVINRTGCREKRKRLLPAHVMIRYVIAMGLYGREPAEEVMRRLVGSLRTMVRGRTIGRCLPVRRLPRPGNASGWSR